jgi:membrane protein
VGLPPQILLFGAEMTQVWANRFGSKVEPARGAVRISERERARAGG